MTHTCHKCGPETDACITRGGISVCAQCGGVSIKGRAAVYADIATLAPGDIEDLTRQRRRVVPHARKSGRQ